MSANFLVRGPFQREGSQFRDLAVHRRFMARGERIDRCARLIAVVSESEQLTDIVEYKAKIAGSANGNNQTQPFL